MGARGRNFQALRRTMPRIRPAGRAMKRRRRSFVEEEDDDAGIGSKSKL
jgi:hypothetical protein